MKISTNRPDVLRVSIRAEKGDEMYHKCMWAEITFDFGTYSIMAQSDCGDYSYRWSQSKEETFLDLCLRMLRDEEYLLGKFSERSVFDLEESKILFRDLHKSDPEYADMIRFVDGVCAHDERDWVEQLQDNDIKEPWDYIIRDYPAQAKTFVRLLGEFALPELRKEKMKHESE